MNTSLEDKDLDMILVVTTFSTQDEAVILGKNLIEAKLVACVQISQPFLSIYKWEGKLEQSTEVSVQLKTIRTHWNAIVKRIQETHPYETPELISIPINGISETYKAWMLETLEIGKL